MNIPKRIIITSAVIIVVASVSSGSALYHSAHHSTSQKHGNSNHASDNKAAPAPDTKAKAVATTEQQKSPATNHAAPPTQKSAPPSNAACKILALEEAQKILGSPASNSTPRDLSIPQDTGTTLASCAYAAGSSTIQLTVRSAVNSLGASENATIFGSGKPAGTVAVPGYGQSAYWDPGSARLNILSKNNWYMIVTSQNTQQASETIATLVKGGM